MNRKKILSGLLWKFGERCGAQGVSFLVSIILARILTPEDYGTIALVMVFTNILSVFVDSGLGNALIQKKDADDIDFSTVFYFNLIVCIVLYIIMFLLSPIIASFYGRPKLTLVIRVLSLTLIISGVKNIQQAFVSKNMLFKRFFFATIGGTVGAAVVGVFLAYKGFGVWALVVQQLFNSIVDTLILWITVDWKPKWVFSKKRLIKLFDFGWKLLTSSLINQIYIEIRSLIIGRVYTPTSLAYYNQGDKFPLIIVTNVNSSIDSVLFPAMSLEQNSVNKIKNMTRSAIKISTYIMCPLMIGLAFISESVVKLILTDKWLPCVVFLRIFCITYMFFPIHTANLNAINSMGRSDIYLKLEIEKKIMAVVVLLGTMWISVEAMAYSALVTSIASQIINSRPNKKLLDYSYYEQLRDIFPTIILSVFMGICVYPISYLKIPIIFIIIIQIVVGGGIYIMGSLLLQIDSFKYLFDLLKQLIDRNK